MFVSKTTSDRLQTPINRKKHKITKCTVLFKVAPKPGSNYFTYRNQAAFKSDQVTSMNVQFAMGRHLLLGVSTGDGRKIPPGVCAALRTIGGPQKREIGNPQIE